MSIEIRFIPYKEGNVVHLGEGYSKEDCLRLIGDIEPHQKGIYEYIVHDYKVTFYASNVDSLAVDKTLDRIFTTS